MKKEYKNVLELVKKELSEIVDVRMLSFGDSANYENIIISTTHSIYIEESLINDNNIKEFAEFIIQQVKRKFPECEMIERKSIVVFQCYDKRLDFGWKQIPTENDQIMGKQKNKLKKYENLRYKNGDTTYDNAAYFPVDVYYSVYGGFLGNDGFYVELPNGEMMLREDFNDFFNGYMVVVRNFKICKIINNILCKFIK